MEDNGDIYDVKDDPIIFNEHIKKTNDKIEKFLKTYKIHCPSEKYPNVADQKHASVIQPEDTDDDTVHNQLLESYINAKEKGLKNKRFNGLKNTLFKKSGKTPEERTIKFNRLTENACAVLNTNVRAREIYRQRIQKFMDEKAEKRREVERKTWEEWKLKAAQREAEIKTWKAKQLEAKQRKAKQLEAAKLKAAQLKEASQYGYYNMDFNLDLSDVSVSP